MPTYHGELQEDKNKIQKDIKKLLDDFESKWGVNVKSIDLSGGGHGTNHVKLRVVLI